MINAAQRREPPKRRSGRIRVGVVGVGYWGSKHVTALRSIDQVASVIGIDQRYDKQEIRRTAAELDLEVYGDLNEVLPLVDAVVVATPPLTHWSIGMSVIQAGCHLLIEKPMALTTDEALQLIHGADAAGTVLMVGHTFEHNAAVHKLREVVTGEQFGKLYHLHFARLNIGIYRQDVNVIFDLATHDVSIANFILGVLPDTITAWASRNVHPDQEDVAHLNLYYDAFNVNAHIHVSWLDPVKVRRVTIVGSKQMAVFDDLTLGNQIRVYDRSARLVMVHGPNGNMPEVRYHRGEFIVPKVPESEPLVMQDRHFVECISGARRPSTDGYNGLGVVKVLECAQISLAEKRTVNLHDAV